MRPYSIASLAHFAPETHNLSRPCPDQLYVKYEGGIINYRILSYPIHTNMLNMFNMFKSGLTKQD